MRATTMDGAAGRSGARANAERSAFAAYPLVVAALLSLSHATATPAGAAAEAVFTIGNYPVDAVDQDAVRAKTKALADGQQAAFRSLLRRLVPVTSYRRIPKLQAKPGEMIDGVSVRSERNSSTQYIANLDFSFQPQAVRSFLKREGLPFVDAQAPEVVVVPVFRDAQGASIDAGPWADAWKGLDLGHSLTPAKVEKLKEAIHADTLKMALANDGGADRILSGEYNSERVVLAFADFDAGSQRINVVFSGRDAVGPLYLKRSWRLTSDRAYALEYAAVVGLGILEGRWKATQIAGHAPASTWAPPSSPGYGGGGGSPSGSGQVVQIEAQFTSQSQWNDMRRQLLDTPGVESVEIGSITARSASITLRYPGGGDRLSQTLSAQGLDLRGTGSGWSLRPNF